MDKWSIWWLVFQVVVMFGQVVVMVGWVVVYRIGEPGGVGLKDCSSCPCRCCCRHVWCQWMVKDAKQWWGKVQLSLVWGQLCAQCPWMTQLVLGVETAQHRRTGSSESRLSEPLM